MRIAILASLILSSFAAANDSSYKRLDHFVSQYCIDCHGDEEAKGETNIEAMIMQRPLVRNTDKWRRIMDLIETKEMPPKKKRQPKETERRAALADLDRLINQFDYSAVKTPGYEPTRRLTRIEYNHTIRSLLDVDYNVEDRFPPDLTGSSGFDNSANSLFLQPIQLERYLAAADVIIDRAFTNGVNARGYRLRSPNGTTSEAHVQTLLKRFVTAAYRRPVSADELAIYLNRYQYEKKAGDTHEEALKTTLKTVLASPGFLFRIERAPDNTTPFRIDAYDLANRLSYFLWSTMPDKPLLETAADGSLLKATVLQSQVKRMLQDPRAKIGLGDLFAGQWLGFDKCGTRIRIDPIDNPFATEAWYEAMREESARFITHLVKHDRPISELLTANYTYLNETLARHYRIKSPKITGSEHRLVTLERSMRGGLLSHGSILFTTSFPDRTSPVKRGTWVLTELLGTPPPPPPPNAGELTERAEEARTARDQMRIHRDNPKCYSCHKQIDPLGLGLESFDKTGRYRRRDASGELPDGTKFTGPKELAGILAKKRLPDLRRNLAKKLLAYALGRQLEYYDEPAIRIILANQQKHDTFQTMIQSVVSAYPFQYKQTQGR